MKTNWREIGINGCFLKPRVIHYGNLHGGRMKVNCLPEPELEKERPEILGWNNGHEARQIADDADDADVTDRPLTYVMLRIFMSSILEMPELRRYLAIWNERKEKKSLSSPKMFSCQK